MRQYTFQPNTDWFSRNLRYWEKHLLPYKDKHNLNFLEIGSFEGRAAVWLLDHILTHQTTRLTCVDAFAEPPK